MMTEREIRTFVEQATATGGKWSMIERIVARWMEDRQGNRLPDDALPDADERARQRGLGPR